MIVAATLRAEPAIDFQTARSASLDGVPDDIVLERAAREGRILVTHDRRTMNMHLKAMIAHGEQSPGVLVVIPQRVSVARVVETLILIWSDNRPSTWANAVNQSPVLVRAPG